MKDVKLDLSTVEEGPSIFQNKLKDQISKQIVMHFQNKNIQNGNKEVSVDAPSDFNSEKVHLDVNQSSENHSSNLESDSISLDVD